MSEIGSFVGTVIAVRSAMTWIDEMEAGPLWTVEVQPSWQVRGDRDYAPWLFHYDEFPGYQPGDLIQFTMEKLDPERVSLPTPDGAAYERQDVEEPAFPDRPDEEDAPAT